MNEFKDRLRIIREERGLSQRQLAKLLNIKHSNISRWESGLIEPTASKIIMLAKALNTTTDYLLGQD